MANISVIGICGKSTFMYVDHFHQNGETLVADSVYEEVGGKGINQAIAAVRMGATISFLTAVGDDADGQKCMDAAKANGIDAYFKIKENKTTPFAFILTDKAGENRVTEFKGAELCIEDVLSFKKEIQNSDILLLQQEVPKEVNDVAVRIASESGVKIILNPAPIREISDETAAKVYMVTPNQQEKQVISPNRFKNCITTLGGDGCLINENIKIPPLKVKAVDTTGAGDTFNGVLAACLSEGKSLESACKSAVIASGISVGRRYVLNAIPYRDEVETIEKREEDDI